MLGAPSYHLHDALDLPLRATSVFDIREFFPGQICHLSARGTRVPSPEDTGFAKYDESSSLLQDMYF